MISQFFLKPDVNFILIETEASSERIINEHSIHDFAIKDVINEKQYEGMKLLISLYINYGKNIITHKLILIEAYSTVTLFARFLG
ncbi:MAG: hypothetical protein ABIY50_00025 [Ignavibacteria bacterium]